MEHENTITRVIPHHRLSHRSTPGFTLIELLVSISIIGLLSSSVLAALADARVKARDANRIANAGELRTALELYQNSSGSYAVTGTGYQNSGSGYMTKSGVTNYTTSIISGLKAAGVYNNTNLSDPVYADEEYYLGTCATTSGYSLYLKVEQDSLKQASTTIAAGCDGVNAVYFGFNYLFSEGNSSGATAGGGSGSGGGSLACSSWGGYWWNWNLGCSSGQPLGTIQSITGGRVRMSGSVFDGTNIWSLTSSGASALIKVTPSLAGSSTVTVPSGYASGYAMAFDGTNIWTSGSLGSLVRFAPDMSTTTYTDPGMAPRAIAFDGTNIWTANSSYNSVSKVTPGGAITNYLGTGGSPRGIAFDGTNMWTANFASSSVTKIAPDGSMTTYNGTGAGPTAIAFDGTNMWTADNSDNSVTRISPSGSMSIFAGTGVLPTGIAFDGTNMWTSNSGDNSFTRIDSSGTMTNFSGMSGSPQSIVFDGTSMWAPGISAGYFSRIFVR